MAKKTAIELVQEYKQKKGEVKPIPDKISPVLKSLVPLLTQIANRKEIPVEINNEIIPSDVKVEAPIVNIPPFPDFKEQTINIDSFDYGEILLSLKNSVNKLEVTLSKRPRAWKVIRNSKGFIEEVIEKK